MKIVVRHEGLSDQEVEQTCVWVVGDDGETVSTEYLKPGEQVDIQIGASARVETATGEVGPIATPEAEAAEEVKPDEDQKVGERPGEDGATGDGASGEAPPGAPGVPSGGDAGGSVAE